MFLFLHAPVAIALTEQIQNPLFAFIIGAASHFLTDLIPHGDRQTDEYLATYSPRRRTLSLALMGAIDSLLLIGVLFVIFNSIPATPQMLAAVAGSIAPDYLWGLHEITRWKLLDGYRNFHAWFQSFRGKDVPLWFGITYQVLLAFLTILYITK